jgi:prepilin-type N-terminal cleavage/methylation domain-containing protein
MKRNGFSLVELVVVMAIIGILSSIATLAFNRFVAKGKIEGQVRTMSADILKARSEALYQKVPRRVVASGTQFMVYSAARVIRSTTLVNPVTSATIDFDNRGAATPATSVICVTNNTYGAAIDSILVTTVNVQMGRKREGGSCVSADILMQ